MDRVELMRMRAASARMQARAMSDVTMELVEGGRVELCDALLADFQMSLDKEPTVKTPVGRKPWWHRLIP